MNVHRFTKCPTRNGSGKAMSTQGNTNTPAEVMIMMSETSHVIAVMIRADLTIHLANIPALPVMTATASTTRTRAYLD